MARKLLLLLGAMWMYNANAQRLGPEIVSSAGATYQGASMQIDWTLGELAVTTLQNPTQQVTQGFHQPVYSVTSIHELTVEAGQIKVYPNPTSGQLGISLAFDRSREIQMKLFDLHGRLIWAKEDQGEQISESILLSQLSSGPYFLHFFIGDNEFFQTIKIQKLD